jgi:VanZ family protein
MLHRLAQIGTWLLAAAIVMLSLVPPKLRPVTDIGHNYEHAAIFFMTGIAAAIGYRVDIRILCSVAIVFCGGLELVQNFVPGRHARITDFIVDSGAAVLGLLLVRSFLARASLERHGAEQ